MFMVLPGVCFFNLLHVFIFLFVFLYVQQRTEDSLEELFLSFHNVEPRSLDLSAIADIS